MGWVSFKRKLESFKEQVLSSVWAVGKELCLGHLQLALISYIFLLSNPRTTSSLRDFVWRRHLWYFYVGIKVALLVIGSNRSSVSVSQNLTVSKRTVLGIVLLILYCSWTQSRICWQLRLYFTQSECCQRTYEITAVAYLRKNSVL